jgi:lipase chaperone LimK
MTRNARFGLTALAVAAAVALVALRFDGNDPATLTADTTASASRGTPDAAPDSAPQATATPGTAAGRDPVPAVAADIPDLPTSLQGTESDGGVTLDANGRLVPDLALRRLFDHYLSSIGERSIDEIRALLAARLDQITTPEGKRQAQAVFERYLRYLEAVDSSAARLEALALRERLAMLRDLRRQHLGSEMAGAFFGAEEAYQQYTLDSRELADDAALTADERSARQRELTAALPEAVRQPLLEQQRVETDLADALAIDTLASDADERHRLRVQRYGEEAAARLELLDRERAAWDARVAAYQAERARLAPLDAARRQTALDEYLSRNFSEAEQRRIRSLQDVGEL